MSDDQTIRLLEEIRDLLRDQGERQRRMHALQEQAVANQLESVEKQKEAVEAYRRVLRRVVPPLMVALALVFVLLLVMMMRWL